LIFDRFMLKGLKNIFYILLFVMASVPHWASAQETIVEGKITDETNAPAPYASVFFKGTTVGMVSDENGFYHLKILHPTDSISVSYLGYATQSKLIKKGITQTINFKLVPEEGAIDEVVVIPRENPAFAIMRKVVKNKDKNDKRGLTAFEFESYNRLEVSVDNLSDKFKKGKLMKNITPLLDSLHGVKGEDGKLAIPIYISEAISNVYQIKNPHKSKVVVEATKITGVGVQDGTTISQFLGTSFQEYNFYLNWVNIINKDFVSPISDGWKGYYEYSLEDSMFLDNKWCYKIDVKPKRVQDLAFTGTIWIHDTTFALKKIEVSIGKGANINYIEKIKITQELEQTEAGPWMPSKIDLIIDLWELRETSPGMILNSHTSFKSLKVNQPRPASFFDKLLIVKEDATIKDQLEKDFWETRRHDSMSVAEKSVYAMIDSIKDVPMVKTYIEILNIVVNGYKKVGKVDIGPYLGVYAYNVVEGHRLSLGFRTNISFSKKWIVGGYAAYGTRDNLVKYAVGANYIFSRNRWTTLGIERKFDIDRLGLSSDALTSSGNTLFLAFSKWGTMRGAYYSEQNTISFQSELFKDFTQKVMLKNKSFDPTFPFAYYSDPEIKDSTLSNKFTTTEVIFETRYAKNESFIQNDNDRISLGTEKWPIFTARYAMGVKGVLGSQFNYHKLSIDMNHVIIWGAIGRTHYNINAGHIFTHLPYPLLEVHTGNQSPFYTSAAFNLMNYFEFVSDSYISLKYRHYFGGLFFNRIPLIKKLKWRFLTTGGLVYGGLSQKNLSLIPLTDKNGDNTRIFSSLHSLPYAEVGYGIENIFKVMRIDAFHRLTYLNKPGVRSFGVKISFQFIL
jgi:hypothetical protein